MRRIASVNQSREDFWSEAVCGRARRQPARIGRGLGAAVRERERVERPTAYADFEDSDKADHSP
jgi:hypothetical protein